MPIPRITLPLALIDLKNEVLELGDTNAVITKGVSAFAKITARTGSLSLLQGQMNATFAGIDAAQAEAVGHPIYTVNVGGAARYSAGYIAAIQGAAISTGDVFAGAELTVTGIEADGERPTDETFIAEFSPNGPRWAGPLLVQAQQPAPENVPPVANAGANASVILGETFRRSGDASTDNDGTIASYEWRLNGQIVSIQKTLEYTAQTVGTYNFVLYVTDNNGARSPGDGVTLTVSAVPQSGYAQAVNPTGSSRRSTNNSASITRTYRSPRRPVFLASGDAMILQRARLGVTFATTYDVVDIYGNTLAVDVRTEREGMASFTDNDILYGIRDSSGGIRHLARVDWRRNQFDNLYEPGGELFIGDGHGRISNDDRYVVIRRERGNTLVCVDMQRGIVVGSRSTPSDYRWATITPDGNQILIGNAGLDRYEQNLSGKTTLVSTDDAGDCVLGEDGRVYYVQSGPIPRIIDVAAGTIVNINTSGQPAVGPVSGVSLVPGYVCASWRVGGLHQLVTMNLADGTAMWTNRAVWQTLPAPTEPRDYAQPAGVPSPNGQRIAYRVAETPASGDFDIYIAE